MQPPQPLSEAGLSFEFQDENTRLVVRDTSAEGCAIRNRGGEALATYLKSNRQIKALDIRESNISDNGISLLSLALRQTDQLEELLLSPVGHTGLEFALGIVRRCSSLQSLSAEIRDVPTLFAGRQNLSPSDYDMSAYVAPKVEGEEEEEEAPEDEEEAEAKAAAKVEQLKKLFSANDYDSGDEGAVRASDAPPVVADGSASPALEKLLADLVQTVRQRPNLTTVDIHGDCISSNVRIVLERTAAEHRAQLHKKASESQEQGARTASDAMEAQMHEILMMTNGTVEENASSSTRLGIRSYVGRRLHSALGEALFECQRFKSKENEALSTSQGEMAFIAMYLRRQMAAEVGA